MRDLIIVGGGAAGLFAAAHSGSGRVLLLEKNRKTGKKILLTGSGMCNITNSDDPEEFLKHFGNREQTRFLKPALMDLTTADLRRWFEERGLELTQREDGKVFPATLKARSVVELLYREARNRGVEIRTAEAVTAIEKDDKGFQVFTPFESYRSRAVLLTTGGKSYPSTGSDGSGFDLARALGHSLVEPTQALVSLVLDPHPFGELAGNSIRGSLVDFYRQGEEKRYFSARGDLLFTHKGLSGPVILNHSRDIRKNDLLRATLIPTENREQARSELQSYFQKVGNRSLRLCLKGLGLFNALVDKVLILKSLPADLPCSQLKKKQRTALIGALLDFPMQVSRKGFFSSAMVTAGGVDLQEVDRKTMESRLVPGLFLAGEVLDIDGHTGGYNLQAAFSTACLAVNSFSP